MITPPSPPQPTVSDTSQMCPGMAFDVLSTAEDPEPEKPSSIRDVVARIKAFYSSGVLQPLKIKFTREIYNDFLDASKTAGHPLFKMRYTYDSITSTLIVKCNKTPVYDASERYFHTAYKDVVEAHSLSRSEQSPDLPDTGRCSGAHQVSPKTADLMITPSETASTKDEVDDPEPLNDDDFLGVAVKVGFSEEYENLVRDMETKLERSKGKTRVVIIICFTEDLVYTSNPFMQPPPIKKESLLALDISALALALLTPDEQESRRPYGPVMRDGHVYLGEVTAFLEIWRYDTGVDAPYCESKMSIIPADDRDTHFSLTMLDIYGSEDRIPDQFKPTDPVEFPLEVCRRRIRMMLSSLERGRI